MFSDERIAAVMARLGERCESNACYFKSHTVMVPSRLEVIKIIKRAQMVMFPDYFTFAEDEGRTCEEILEELFLSLKRR